MHFKVTPNLRGATFTEIIFLDHIKVYYLNLHFTKNELKILKRARVIEKKGF